MRPFNSRRNRNPQPDEETMPRESTNRQSMQLSMLNLPDNRRNNLIAVIGEFVGTFLFLFWSFVGTQISNTPQPPPGSNPNTSNLLFSALAFGFSLTVNVWAFYRVTGGLFNPSVTMALFLVGGLPAVRSLLIVLAQILGGICAAAVVSALFPGPLNVATKLGGGTNTAQGLFIEVFLTAQLVFVVIMLAVVKHRSTYLAPVGIGLAFFLMELCGIFYTGGSLNFARSLGPAIVNRSFPHYFWIYFLGPVLGSGLACGFYCILNSMRYQTCNPGQDADGIAEAGGLKEGSTSSSYDVNDPDYNNRTGANGVGTGTGTRTGNARAPDDYERNFSNATAVNPDYAGPGAGTNGPYSKEGSNMSPSTNGQSYGNTSANRAPGSYGTQPVSPYTTRTETAGNQHGLNPVNETVNGNQANRL